MSNLQPEQRADKHGKVVTRHINPDKGVSNGTTQRVGGTAPVASAKPVVDSPYIFVSETSNFEDKEYFDVRDISSAFDTYAVELDTYMEQFEGQDKSTIMFDTEDESDIESFTDLKEQASDWRGVLQSLSDYVSNIDVPDEPESDSISEWSKYLMGISRGFQDVCDNHSPTMTRNDEMEDRTKEFFEETGAIASDMPDVLRRNINWEAIADEIKGEAPEATVGSTVFYLA